MSSDFLFEGHPATDLERKFDEMISQLRGAGNSASTESEFFQLSPMRRPSGSDPEFAGEKVLETSLFPIRANLHPCAPLTFAVAGVGCGGHSGFLNVTAGHRSGSRRSLEDRSRDLSLMVQALALELAELAERDCTM